MAIMLVFFSPRSDKSNSITAFLSFSLPKTPDSSTNEVVCKALAVLSRKPSLRPSTSLCFTTLSNLSRTLSNSSPNLLLRAGDLVEQVVGVVHGVLEVVEPLPDVVVGHLFLLRVVQHGVRGQERGLQLLQQPPLVELVRPEEVDDLGGGHPVEEHLEESREKCSADERPRHRDFQDAGGSWEAIGEEVRTIARPKKRQSVKSCPSKIDG
ncbi:hypothetical protein EUGRSUZ_L01260 [Eucalyptus grandis]|uniref:Uncharacterized protein n=1 Tax=Eucalyptus grandis TaxID=71139 RepID=A0A058ZUK1_EUCGR|nr:hypothetical protein EUGRSUZ_L01260 [Eucalyptus grandis]